jgi:hypothetical protein
MATACSVTLGVDTHKDLHVAVTLDQVGRRLGVASFGTDDAHHASLWAWASDFGPIIQAGVEGTGSFGYAGRLVGSVSEADLLIRQGYPRGATDASAVDAARYPNPLDKATGTRSRGDGRAGEHRSPWHPGRRRRPAGAAPRRQAAAGWWTRGARWPGRDRQRSAQGVPAARPGGGVEGRPRHRPRRSASPPARSRSRPATGWSACVARCSTAARSPRRSGRCRAWTVARPSVTVPKPPARRRSHEANVTTGEPMGVAGDIGEENPCRALTRSHGLQGRSGLFARLGERAVFIGSPRA